MKDRSRRLKENLYSCSSSPSSLVLFVVVFWR